MFPRIKPPLRDAQDELGIATCPECGGEVHPYALVGSINGELYHEDCMTAEEREEYPTYPAISFIEEAC